VMRKIEWTIYHRPGPIQPHSDEKDRMDDLPSAWADTTP